jgi:hypothetical protein
MIDDELLNVAAGVLLGIGALAIKQALFPDLSGLAPGVGFIVAAYAVSQLTEDSL